MSALLPETARAGGAAASAAEQLLADEADRALRFPRGRLALALHLSRLKRPARAHHTRIARALLQDTALRLGGQVFAMRNGDIVLLCAEASAEEEALAAAPLTLPAAFARLFGADSPDPAQLTTLWHLAEEAAQFRDFVAQRQADPAAPSPVPEAEIGGVAPVSAVDSLIDGMKLEAALTQQTAVRVSGSAPMPLGSRLQPVFRCVRFALPSLVTQPALRQALADPFLQRHFAARMDARLLEMMHDDLRGGGRLVRPAMLRRLPIHMPLSLEGIASPAFGRLAQAARQAEVRFAAEVTMMEAASDPALVAHARDVLAASGVSLVIHGLDHIALAMTHPAGLQPALVKLAWSPLLRDSGPAVDAGIVRIGADRVVLEGADGEAALQWGKRRGIHQYQGIFLDAVQATRRIAVCHSARFCTLRQCITRAGTFEPAVRGACGNPALLDLAHDPPGGASGGLPS